MRCRKCSGVYRPTQLKNKRCWRDFNMCYTCAVILHPEAYPKNVILARLARIGKYKSARKHKTYHKVNGDTSYLDSVNGKYKKRCITNG